MIKKGIKAQFAAIRKQGRWRKRDYLSMPLATKVFSNCTLETDKKKYVEAVAPLLL